MHKISLLITQGPQAWHRRYPIARQGTRQSPINIIIEPDRRNIHSVCCDGVCKDAATSSSKSVHYSDCLRQRMTQDISLHEQNQNTNNINRRNHHHHNQHHHHHHHHGPHHRHHHHSHHSHHNENEESLDSQGNSPVRGSLSSSSVGSASSLSSPMSKQQSQSITNSDYHIRDQTTTTIHMDESNNSSTNNARDNNSASMCHYRQSHKKIFLGYPRSLNNLHVTNTGHGWQINIPNEIGQHTRRLNSLI